MDHGARGVYSSRAFLVGSMESSEAMFALRSYPQTQMRVGADSVEFTPKGWVVEMTPAGFVLWTATMIGFGVVVARFVLGWSK
jgi:hypothetical protein